MEKNRAALLCGAIFMIAFLTWWLVARLGDADFSPRKGSVGRSVQSTADLNHPLGGNAQLGNSQSVGDQASLSMRASNRLSWMQDMAQMVQGASTSENVASRSYAVYTPAQFCTAVRMAHSYGAGNLEADMPKGRIFHDESAVKRIAQRCNTYYALGIDNLRTRALLALKAENAPMPAFFSAIKGDPNQARAQLARVLTDYDPTALQPLAMVWPLMNTDRLATTLPDELKPYAQGIATAAFDIALCRGGAYCGAGSVALDMVCMKFAECEAPDVEEAYRRLHSASGISFDETRRIAESIQDAVKRKDANALWPDTAKWPEKRK